MAGSLVHLRSTFKARSNLLLRNKLTCCESYYADDSTKKHNLYETLGIHSNATHGEIKKAYYDLTMRYHPDRNESCDISATKFREVTEAYEILGNFSLRKKYDRGVPLSLMKKSVPVPIDHNVKYQEFYDSRTSQSNFNDNSENFDDFANFTEKKEDHSNIEQKEESFRPSIGTQMLIVVFISTLLLLFKR